LVPNEFNGLDEKYDKKLFDALEQNLCFFVAMFQYMSAPSLFVLFGKVRCDCIPDYDMNIRG
jgi:hypothetical protein